MISGISTACFYPQYTEQTLHMLADKPPQCVEVFINAAAELSTSYLKELRKIADDAGINIASVHPYTSGIEPMYFFSRYERRYQEGLDVYKRFYHAANLLGANIVVFHGAMRSFKIPYSEYFARFVGIWEDAKRNGVELCQENVQRCTSYKPEFFTAMTRALPDVGFVLDTKQAVRAGRDVFAFAETMSGRIRHIHISDHSSAQDCMVPGKGVLNIVKLLNLAGKNGFDGAVIVELYRENFDSIVDIYEGYQQISTAISTIRQNT